VIQNKCLKQKVVVSKERMLGFSAGLENLTFLQNICAAMIS